MLIGEDSVQPPSLCCCGYSNQTARARHLGGQKTNASCSKPLSHIPAQHCPCLSPTPPELLSPPELPAHTCCRHHVRSSCLNGTHLMKGPSQLCFRLPTVTAARSSTAPNCLLLLWRRATASSKRCRDTYPSQQSESSSRTSVQFTGSAERPTRNRCCNKTALVRKSS
jgi:hypothetical protein